MDKPSRLRAVPVILSLLVIFSLDIVISRDYAIWIAYILPLLLANRKNQPLRPLPVAIISIMLIFISFFFKPPAGITPAIELINRLSIVSVALLIVAYVLEKHARNLEALRESEEKFAWVLNNSPDAAYRRDLRTDRYDYLGPVLERFIGYTREEMNSMDIVHVLENIHPEDVSRVKTTLEKLKDESRKNGRASAVLEYRFRRKDGDYRWLEDHLTEISDTQGRPLYRLGVVREVTSRKRIESELKREHSLLQTIFDSVPVMFIIYDPQIQKIRNNRYLEQVTGWTQEEISRGDFMTKVYPDPAYRAQVEEYMRSLAPGFRDLVMTGKDGGRIASSWANIRLADGRLVGIGLDMRERNRIIKALQDSQAKLKAALSSTTDAVAISDLEGNFIDFNEAFATFNRFRSKKECARNLSEYASYIDVYLPDGNPAPFDMWAIPRALRGERASDAEYMLRRKDTGEKWWGNYSFAPVRYDGGGIAGAIISARDITGRKHAEEALRSNKEFLERIMSSSLNGLYIFDLNKQSMSFINRQYTRLTGYSFNEIMSMTGSTFYGLFHPDDLSRVLAYVEAMRSLKDNEIREIEYRFRRKDGQWRWMLSRESLFRRNPDGSVREYIGSFIDINERKLAEEKLKESQEQLRYAFEQYQLALVSAGLGTVIYYPDSREIILDARSRNFFGFRGDEAVSIKKIEGRIAAQDRARIAADMRRVIFSGEGMLDLEFRVMRPEGGERWISLKGKAVGGVSKKHETVRFAGLFMDITRRKEAEEIVKRDRDVLDRLVTQRSYKLLETQHELNRFRRLSDIGQLAATIAHELRNPLAAIHMAGMNIRRRADNPAKLATSLGTIDKKIAESDQIINNLLFYSRLRISHFEKTDVRNVLEESMRTSRMRFPERDVEVGLDTRDLKEAAIRVDPLQIKELFVNVINNAFDAIPDGKKGKIEIVAREKDESVEVTVLDNGAGISRDNLARIFQPFFTTKSKGTGLGLAVCRQIAEAHRGGITVDSELGKGTAVKVILPRNQPR